MAQYMLEMRNITKDFVGGRALDNVTLGVERGEIHALCGENGAGKSTLMKVLSGVYPCSSFEGDIIVNGELRRFENVRDSESCGISIIHQELQLIKELNVTENVFLGSFPMKKGLINWDQAYAETSELLNELGLDINPDTKVKHLGIGKQQLVAIAKALRKNSDVLVLDEPTAALTEHEVDILLRFILNLKNRGITCIYISHRFNEIFRISDKITVLRDGKAIGTFNSAEMNENKLISMMVGRELSDRFPKVERVPGEVIMEVLGLTVFDPDDSKKTTVRNVSFQVRQGEIIGISGLMGAGRTELITSIFGAAGGKRIGAIRINGKDVVINKPKDAIKYGVALVSEDRKRYGLVLEQSVAENITLASLDEICDKGVINSNKELSISHHFIRSLKIKTPSTMARVNTLSGGNQQKVVLAKWLMAKPKILFLDEPTRGIDIGAKFDIYNIMNELVRQGVAIVMVSSELQEILGMSDRILVMHQGGIAAEISAEEATQERIMHYATGGRGGIGVGNSVE